MAKKQAAINDPDLAKVGVALKRAAANARKLGFETNTPVYVYRDGKIVDIVAEHRKTQSRKKVGNNTSKPRKQGRTRQPSSTKPKR